MFLGMAVEFNTNLTAPVPPGGPLPAGHVLKPIPFSAVHHHQAGLPRLSLWESTSGNWSGYAVPLETSHVTDTFSFVLGSWVVPAVTGAQQTDNFSSVWVGLDGYADGTVEQIGTEQDWLGTSQVNYAWFEMYPSGAWELDPADYPVNTGDKISAQVSYVGEFSVSIGRGLTEPEFVFDLTITDVSNGRQKWSFSTYPNYASYSSTFSAARSSAEWIVEGPSSSSGILPLADFGAVNFAGCMAIGKSRTIEPISFWPDDPLTMIDPNGGGASPSSLVTKGSGGIATSAFSVTWAAQ
jgi:hypothetical protein